MNNLLKFYFSVLIAFIFILFATTTSFAANGNVNWEQGNITAVGMGVAPPNTVNVAQARMLARRAAVVDAYRQMAEIISGVSVTSESTVENFMAISDKTRVKVNATIKGAKIISEGKTPDGGYEVTMVVPIFGITGSLASAVMEPSPQKEMFPQPVANVDPSPVNTGTSVSTTVTVNIPTTTTPSAPSQPVKPNVPSVPSNGSSAAPAPEGKAIGGFTGLIVDCRGLGLEPVMSPVIKNDAGSPIYGYKNLDSDKVVSYGMAGYAKDITNAERAGANPLLVKAIRVEGNNCNPVLTTADANRVLIENGATGFLDNTNVVFVR